MTATAEEDAGIAPLQPLAAGDSSQGATFGPMWRSACVFGGPCCTGGQCAPMPGCGHRVVCDPCSAALTFMAEQMPGASDEHGAADDGAGESFGLGLLPAVAGGDGRAQLRGGHGSWSRAEPSVVPRLPRRGRRVVGR